MFFSIIFLMALSAYAVEVKNLTSKVMGNRVQFMYDLAGGENEEDVNVTIKIDGKEYKASELHLEGDLGKVKPGRGRTIWWNVLQDFPRGLDKDVICDVTAVIRDFKDPATGMELIFVKGGCYQMGDIFNNGDAAEKPAHEVCISNFFIGKYEVTQAQWRSVMDYNPSKFSRCGDSCPVEKVSWNDVEDFISRLNAKSGKKYRLPTEAEWEYAARSGGKKEEWAGISNEASLGEYAWYYSVSGNTTHPVGTKLPNGLGLHDMSGNVWEWCSDWYGGDYYRSSSRENPKGPSSASNRVLRGGSWYDEAWGSRASLRYSRVPGNRDTHIGFRLSCSADP